MVQETCYSGAGARGKFGGHFDIVPFRLSQRHHNACTACRIPLTFVELLLALEAGLGGRRAALDPQARQVHAAVAARGRGAAGVAAAGRRRHHGRGGGGGGPGRAVQVGDGDVVRGDGAGMDGGQRSGLHYNTSFHLGTHT